MNCGVSNQELMWYILFKARFYLLSANTSSLYTHIYLYNGRINRSDGNNRFISNLVYVLTVNSLMIFRATDLMYFCILR